MNAVRLNRALPIPVIVMFAVMGARAKDAKPTLKSVGDQVFCPCGCAATLNQCPHPASECSARAEMEALIQKDAALGKTETATLQDFVLRYGVKVLSTPPARGFNLLVWVLPGLGLIAGLAFVIVITRRWRKPPHEPEDTSPASVDAKVLEAVEKEIKASRLGVRD